MRKDNRFADAGQGCRAIPAGRAGLRKRTGQQCDRTLSIAIPDRVYASPALRVGARKRNQTQKVVAIMRLNKRGRCVADQRIVLVGADQRVNRTLEFRESRGLFNSQVHDHVTAIGADRAAIAQIAQRQGPGARVLPACNAAIGQRYTARDDNAFVDIGDIPPNVTNATRAQAQDQTIFIARGALALDVFDIGEADGRALRRPVGQNSRVNAVCAIAVHHLDFKAAAQRIRDLIWTVDRQVRDRIARNRVAIRIKIRLGGDWVLIIYIRDPVGPRIGIAAQCVSARAGINRRSRGKPRQGYRICPAAGVDQSGVGCGNNLVIARSSANPDKAGNSNKPAGRTKPEIYRNIIALRRVIQDRITAGHCQEFDVVGLE